MLRSMYSGISGMKNFQVKLDVIGNNIANVNTYGYKKGRTTFKDLINQQISGAAAATGNRGGINPQQVGLGSQISSIDTIHTTGSTQTTSRTLDLALGGDGFFPVATIKDPGRINIDRGNQIGDNRILGAINNAVDMNYTRAGNFYLDDRGYLVTSDGMFVVGETGEKSVPSNIEVRKSNTALTAIGTFEDSYKDMQDSVKELDTKANSLLKAYQDYGDSLAAWEGASKPANGSLKNAMDDAYRAMESIHKVFNDFVIPTNTSGYNANAKSFAEPTAVGAVTKLNTSIAAFNTNPLTNIISQTSTVINSNGLAAGTEYPNIPTNGASGSPLTNGEVIKMRELIGEISNIKVDLEKIAQSVINYENAAEELQQPKWTDSLSGQAGLIQIPLTAKSFSIGPDGTVTFVNGKGELNLAGQIRVANFANAGGLEKLGGNLFRESANSGAIDRDNNGIQLDELSVPGSEGVASIVAGSLEMSNVDLAEEFTEMIVAQRGFQSNTKIITTSDEILQELVNLKR